MISYSWAKRRHLSRLTDAGGTFYLLALDHGLTVGPCEGIEDVTAVIDSTSAHGITGVVLNRGFVPRINPAIQVGVILQEMGLPAFNSSKFSKVPTATIEDALRMGVDAISIQLDFASADFDRRFEQGCRFISAAATYELPVLVMVNAHGEENPQFLPHVIRACTEVGADIIKVGLPPSLEPSVLDELRRVIAQSPPVLLAGGPRSEAAFTKSLATAASLGFAGVCVGRNVFQSAEPAKTIATIKRAFTP